MQKATQSELRVPALDGVRGIAIILVVAYHAATAWTITTRSEGVFRLLFGSYGWIGVDLFFVLSGFLITGKLLDSRSQDSAGSYFGNFYMRRVLRIFPLYYLSLFACFYVLPLFSTWAAHQFSEGRSQIIWYLSYTANYNKNISQEPVGHFWSLCIEEQFYLIWPLIIWLTPRRYLLSLLSALIVFGPVLRLLLWEHGHSLDTIYFHTMPRMDTLVFGALVAVLARSPGGLDRISCLCHRLLFIGGAAMLAVYVLSHGLTRTPMTEIFGFTVIGCFFALLIVTVLTSGERNPLRRFFERRSLRSFGKYSYAMYVFHFPFIKWAEHKVSTSETLPRVWGSQIPSSLMLFCATISASYGAAFLSWHLYEKRFLRLKNYF